MRPSKSSTPLAVPPRGSVLGLLVLLTCLLPAALTAVEPATIKVTIKLATLVPEGSTWHTVIREMGADWSRATAGRVRLHLYAGGVAGDEPEAVRKMSRDQLQAATLTVAGLTAIDPGFRVFQIPLFFADAGELYAVLDALRPTFERRLAAQGFELLEWGQVGWVYLFATRPVSTLDELKALPLFVWAGDEVLVAWWTKNGYHPLVLGPAEILPGLAAGKLQALPATPVAAMSLQWFRAASHMTGVGLVPLVGATVVTSKAWALVAPADRAVLSTAAAAAERRLGRELPAQDLAAVEEMKRRGLSVTPMADEKAWRRSAAALAATTRGDTVEPALFDLALAARDAYRASHRGSG
jgi:TRAP-type C4-dicarboxylate transport system substrate-binding protein